MYGDPKAPAVARIDIKNAKVVNDVGLDDILTITVKGKVKRLEGTKEYKDREYLGKGKEKEVTRQLPGTLEIEVSELTVMGEGYGAGMDDV